MDKKRSTWNKLGKKQIIFKSRENKNSSKHTHTHARTHAHTHTHTHTQKHDVQLVAQSKLTCFTFKKIFVRSLRHSPRALLLGTSTGRLSVTWKSLSCSFLSKRFVGLKAWREQTRLIQFNIIYQATSSGWCSAWSKWGKQKKERHQERQHEMLTVSDSAICTCMYEETKEKQTHGMSRVAAGSWQVNARQGNWDYSISLPTLTATAYSTVPWTSHKFV